MKRVVDTFDGITETLHFDEAENTFSIQRTADVQIVADDVAENPAGAVVRIRGQARHFEHVGLGQAGIRGRTDAALH
jgi:hypothetical protein